MEKQISITALIEAYNSMKRGNTEEVRASARNRYMAASARIEKMIRDAEGAAMENALAVETIAEYCSRVMTEVTHRADLEGTRMHYTGARRLPNSYG
jgi:hypothetical protein